MKIKLIIPAVAIATMVMSCSNDDNYVSNLKSALEQMVFAGQLSELITNSYSEVWTATIEDPLYKISGKYTRGNIDSALRYTMDALLEAGMINKVDSVKFLLDSTMKTLTEPPKKYERTQQITLKAFGFASEYLRLAKSPEGSLIAFNRRKNELKNNLISSVEQAMITIPKN